MLSAIVDASTTVSKPLARPNKSSKRPTTGSFLGLAVEPRLPVYQSKGTLLLGDTLKGHDYGRKSSIAGNDNSRKKSIVGDSLAISGSAFKKTATDLETVAPKQVLGSLFEMGSRASSINLHTDLKPEPLSEGAYNEQKYPYLLQMGLHLTRRARLNHRREMRSDLPHITEGTTVLDWM